MSPAKPGRAPPHTDLVKLLSDLARRHSALQVFSDFCEMAALSISNAVDRAQFEGREARHMEIVRRYDRGEAKRFPEMLAALTLSLETGMSDVLGKPSTSLSCTTSGLGSSSRPMNSAA